ncbi:MAG: hypothetical protein ACK5NF_04660 [Bacilli bacterium]
MKKLNLFTAIYSLVFSIFLLIAPLLTLGAVVSEAVEVTGSGSSSSVDIVIRVGSAVMVVLAIVLIIKDDVASNAGKILLIISGILVVILSSFLGFVAGIVGIIGAALLLASNKKYKDL